MVVGEKREQVLTNFSKFKQIGRIIESDHNPIFLYLSLQFSKLKNERITVYQFRNKESQKLFKMLTSNTKDFTNCFKNELSFDEQTTKWRQVLENFFRKSFKKIRITNNLKKKTSEINTLMERRRALKKKDVIDDNEEEELVNIERDIASLCEEANRKRVTDNFKSIGGNDGDLLYQGIWSIKKKYFPKTKPSLPAGKKNIKQQLITNPAELKELYLQTFRYRLRHRPPQPGFENYLESQNELFKLRLGLAKENKSPPWVMKDLEDAIKELKTGKCRDPEGLIREVFKEDALGEDLKQSLLILFNKIKDNQKFPTFMQLVNISAIYKGKGDLNDLESDRGIFLVTICRTILMKMIYKDKYPIIDQSMSDSNIGARKQKNIRNHIFVVNSVIHDILNKKSNKQIDITVLDYKQMFDSECLFECMNDLYEAGVKDDMFSLIYESNRINNVAVQTPHGLSRREVFEEIVMQGDVLAPLISSLQVDTFGKECMEEKKHLFYYKDTVPIGPLGMVDDLLTISECGVNTTLMNQYINFKTATKRLQFGTAKCIKMHVGKSESDILCKDLHVGSWKDQVITDPETGQCTKSEYFSGFEKMKVKSEQTYLGDLMSVDGSQTKNVQQRRSKGLGVINQIMQILQTTFFGKYYFEVAMVLRESLFLSSLLLNSEAWVNYSDKDVRILEQCDEILLTRILDCDSNTSNALKYLDLGILPVRHLIMKRKLAFLQYILKEDKKSMIYQVFKATLDNPLKNDFVATCQKYLKCLDINLSFDDIENMSKISFKKVLKEKTTIAAFSYLEGQKVNQKKIMDIEYSKLAMQHYLADGDRSVKVSQLIFKARGKTLDLKLQKKWKYDDTLCYGCHAQEESGEEMMECKSYGENSEKIAYSWFFKEVDKQISAAQFLMKRLKKREKLREEVT